MLRVVVDTNVLVSGVLSKKGAPAELLDAWRAGRYTLLSSPEIIAEVRAVFHYPHIRDKYRLSEDEIESIITLLELNSVVVSTDAELSEVISDDPKDEMFLACAQKGNADFIVSGDHHLLDLGFYKTIPILSARQFMEMLSK